MLTFVSNQLTTMKYSNVRGLPAPIATAINNSEYQHVKGALSARKLMDSPQIYHLKRQHQIDTDVSDVMWSLIHRGMMQVIENSSPTAGVYRAAQTLFRAINQKMLIEKSKSPSNPEVEQMQQTMDAIVSFANKYFSIGNEDWLLQYTLKANISGYFTQENEHGLGGERIEVEKDIFDTIDMFDRTTGTLWLVRLCSTSMAYKPQYRARWELEASVQSYILECNDIYVKQANMLMVFKDYSEAKRRTNIKYPSGPTISIPLNRVDNVELAAVLRERIGLHAKAEQTGEFECSESDRWATAPEYKVVDPNSKMRPVKAAGFATPEQAAAWIKQNFFIAKNGVIEYFPGESTRCQGYCPVADVCHQWAKEKKEIEERKKNPQRPVLPSHLMSDEADAYGKESDMPEFE